MDKDNISEQAKIYKNQYMREWRKKNKDKVKRYNAEYWERYAKRMKSEEKEGK